MYVLVIYEMRTAIIGLRFKEDVKDDDITEVISDFYENNDRLIKSMMYLEFKEPNMLTDVYKFINERAQNDSTQRNVKSFHD